MNGRHIPSDSTQRHLAWDGCLNVRDLGGLPLPGGVETRFGAVVRADSIRQLTDAGWEALVGYGVRRAIDLRADDECAEDPPRDLPIEVVRAPIPGNEEPAVLAWRTTFDAYLALLARFQRQFARAVIETGRDDSPVVIHCAGGRDRTGLTVALLLRLVGVRLADIAADHAYSDEVYAPALDEWLAEATDDEDRARRRRIATPAGDTMARVLMELERRHGSVRGYLAAGGATADELDRTTLTLVC
jgi:Tyrosine phosphatase family